jgi:phytanoyl-CoA hydroxylase
MIQRYDADDDKTFRRYLCIHFLPKIFPLIRQALSHPKVLDVLTAVVGPHLKSVKSILFIKVAGLPEAK